MRIAVTGATGFVGRHVIGSLIGRQYKELRAIGRTELPDGSQTDFIYCDLLNEQAHDWIKAYRPTHLLHLAWYAEHGQFWSSKLNQEWTEATRRLIEAFCEQGGRHIAVAGTCAEYDWSTDDYCKEHVTPLRPSSEYGKQKCRAREIAMEICHEHGASLAWGRIFYPFGLGESPQRLIPSVVEVFLGHREPFAITTDHWRDLMPVEAVADALVYLVEEGKQGDFNVCSGVPMRLGNVIRTIANTLGKDPARLLAHAARNGSGPKFLVGDNSLLLQEGWPAKYDLDRSLRDYIRYIANSTA